MSSFSNISDLLTRWVRERVSAEELCRERPDLLEEVRQKITVLRQMEEFLGVHSESCGGVAVGGSDDNLTAQKIQATGMASTPTAEQVKRLALEWKIHQLQGMDISFAELCKDAPDLQGEVKRALAAAAQLTDGRLTSAFAEIPLDSTDDKKIAMETVSRYRLERLLGKGSFGEVWQGFDPHLRRKVAIKRPRTDRHFSAAELSEFLREARKIAALKHARIVPVFDVGEEHGAWFLVSAFVEGETLGQRLSLQEHSAEQAAAWVADLANGLHHAHRCDVVHRDVKPSNILVDKEGHVYLTDFGLAVSEEEMRRELPSIRGTFSYMSPEQARGDSNLVDGRADVYGLGMVLYELLTGELPFKGKDRLQIRDQILRRAPKPPTAVRENVPQRLEQICLKCLEKEPANRYATAKQLEKELKSWLRWQKLSRNIMTWYAAVTVLLVVIILLFLLPRFWPNEQPSDGDPPIVAVAHFDPNEVGVKPGVWYSLLRWKPRLKHFPGPPSKFEWERDKRIWLHSNNWGLIALGRAERPGYKIRLTYKEIPWQAVGDFGVYFGFHKSKYVNRRGKEFGCHRYQLIKLRMTHEAGKEKWLIMRASVADLDTDHLGNPSVVQPYGHHLMSFPLNRSYIVEFTVTKKGVHDVLWDGKPVTGVGLAQWNQAVLQAHPKAFQGEFGIRVGDHTVSIRDFAVQYLPEYFKRS